MKSNLKNFRKLLAALGVVVFLMVAGWYGGVGSAEEVFSDTAMALENAVAGTIADGCKYTGVWQDTCFHNGYSVRNCRLKSVMEPTNCQYN